MDHIVYVEAASKEMDRILAGSKKIILRGAMGRKLPYERVFKGDTLYFMNNNGEGLVKATAKVFNVVNTDKLSPDESMAMLQVYSNDLQLSNAQLKRFGGKRYLVLIEIIKPKKIKPIKTDKSNFANMDDWLFVEDINKVIVK